MGRLYVLTVISCVLTGCVFSVPEADYLASQFHCFDAYGKKQTFEELDTITSNCCAGLNDHRGKGGDCRIWSNRKARRNRTVCVVDDFRDNKLKRQMDKCCRDGKAKLLDMYLDEENTATWC